VNADQSIQHRRLVLGAIRLGIPVHILVGSTCAHTAGHPYNVSNPAPVRVPLYDRGLRHVPDGATLLVADLTRLACTDTALPRDSFWLAVGLSSQSSSLSRAQTPRQTNSSGGAFLSTTAARGQRYVPVPS
jgi:hypothetical protein